MKILITGGTGSIGSKLAELIGDCTIFSRNEANQVNMSNLSYRFVLGDVCDYDEIFSACKGMDYVFHFAALKHVEICEKQPMEAIKINVLGTMNVINACLQNGAKLIYMSSDKAISPSNVYGMTKSLSEKMVAEAGYLSVRSGNVLWSSGSVLPKWKNQIEKTNNINITSEKMTRFFISAGELVDFIWKSRDLNRVVTVPMKSFRLIDIAVEFLDRYGDKKSKFNITGLRPGERLHEFREENISSEDCISNDLTYIWK